MKLHFQNSLYFDGNLGFCTFVKWWATSFKNVAHIFQSLNSKRKKTLDLNLENTSFVGVEVFKALLAANKYSWISKGSGTHTNNNNIIVTAREWQWSLQLMLLAAFILSLALKCAIIFITSPRTLIIVWDTFLAVAWRCKNSCGETTNFPNCIYSRNHKKSESGIFDLLTDWVGLGAGNK